jgi:hypothetical protein
MPPGPFRLAEWSNQQQQHPQPRCCQRLCGAFEVRKQFSQQQ